MAFILTASVHSPLNKQESHAAATPDISHLSSLNIRIPKLKRIHAYFNREYQVLKKIRNPSCKLAAWNMRTLFMGRGAKSPRMKWTQIKNPGLLPGGESQYSFYF
jgi:hypothetical protein